jgi:hypothetical protein
MDSKTRTRILYEDPNSIFKANKRVYLHELQGSTLKSAKPFPNDITEGLKTSEILVTLISKLTAFESISDYIFSTIVAQDLPVTGVTIIPYLKEGTVLSTSIKTQITKLLKMPQSTFNEDDVFSINSLYSSIKTTFEYLKDIYRDVPGYDVEELMRTVLFGSFYDKMNNIIKQLEQLIPYMTGVSSVSTSLFNPNVEAADVEFQDVEEGPIDGLEGAGRCRLLRGSGRYKVLSDRAHVIQSQPYKRFL